MRSWLLPISPGDDEGVPPLVDVEWSFCVQGDRDGASGPVPFFPLKALHPLTSPPIFPRAWPVGPSVAALFRLVRGLRGMQPHCDCCDDHLISTRENPQKFGKTHRFQFFVLNPKKLFETRNSCCFFCSRFFLISKYEPNQRTGLK